MITICGNAGARIALITDGGQRRYPRARSRGTTATVTGRCQSGINTMVHSPRTSTKHLVCRQLYLETLEVGGPNPVRSAIPASPGKCVLESSAVFDEYGGPGLSRLCSNSCKGIRKSIDRRNRVITRCRSWGNHSYPCEKGGVAETFGRCVVTIHRQKFLVRCLAFEDAY